MATMWTWCILITLAMIFTNESLILMKSKPCRLQTPSYQIKYVIQFKMSQQVSFYVESQMTDSEVEVDWSARI